MKNDTKITELNDIKAQRKALKAEFDKDIDALYAKYRADVKALREQKAALLAEIAAAKKSKKDVDCTEDAEPEAEVESEDK